MLEASLIFPGPRRVTSRWETGFNGVRGKKQLCSLGEETFMEQMEKVQWGLLRAIWCLCG